MVLKVVPPLVVSGGLDGEVAHEVGEGIVRPGTFLQSVLDECALASVDGARCMPCDFKILWGWSLDAAAWRPAHDEFFLGERPRSSLPAVSAALFSRHMDTPLHELLGAQGDILVASGMALPPHGHVQSSHRHPSFSWTDPEAQVHSSRRAAGLRSARNPLLLGRN